MRSLFTVTLQRKSRRYYPTRLAITLAAGITSKPSSSSNPMDVAPGTVDTSFIVVETNYRIYAYTSMSTGCLSTSLCPRPVVPCIRSYFFSIVFVV